MRNGRKEKGKMVALAAELIIMLAAVLGVSMILESREQQVSEQALLLEAGTLKSASWTDQNTVLLDGQRYGFDHRIETYLFIGTDDSGNNDPENYRGGMADFLLLMVMDHTDNTISYLQIDRNTVTDVRELRKDGTEIMSRQLQICTAHWYGRNPEMAAENTVYAVQKYLGGLAKIDGYFVLNMQDVGSLNHAVGGVEITIQDELDEDHPSLRQGETLVLSDEQAEYFLRVRMAVGEGTNVERLARQRQYMTSFFNKVKEKTSENLSFGLELWDELKSVAVTNMNGNEFSRIAQKLLKGTDRGIHTVRGSTVQGYVLGDGQPHEEFYADDGSVREAMIDLFSLTLIEDEKN